VPARLPLVRPRQASWLDLPQHAASEPLPSSRRARNPWRSFPARCAPHLLPPTHCSLCSTLSLSFLGVPAPATVASLEHLYLPLSLLVPPLSNPVFDGTEFSFLNARPLPTLSPLLCLSPAASHPVAPRISLPLSFSPSAQRHSLRLSGVGSSHSSRPWDRDPQSSSLQTPRGFTRAVRDARDSVACSSIGSRALRKDLTGNPTTAAVRGKSEALGRFLFFCWSPFV